MHTEDHKIMFCQTKAGHNDDIKNRFAEFDDFETFKQLFFSVWVRIVWIWSDEQMRLL